VVEAMNKYISFNDENESPDYVRISLAAAMTLGFIGGRFYRDAKLYTVNLLLTYKDGCIGKCAYCGLSYNRGNADTWIDKSFIRVDWPIVHMDHVLERLKTDISRHVERVCISMVTNRRARRDTLIIVENLRRKMDMISGLITPTIIDKKWLYKLNEAGADKVGIAIDAATKELFEKHRGLGVGGPHKWEKYWNTVADALDVFGRYNVGVHLIVGLGETEDEMVRAIQMAYDMGALTHLFSFFPEDGSPLEKHPQPPIGTYRRIQLARYLINKGLTEYPKMKFDEKGRIIDFGVDKVILDKVVESGLPFMTSGCSGRTMENACNRPYANCTPYQAYIGELRNYPFRPEKSDIEIIRKQLCNYEIIRVSNL
jgi:biotin synthase